jgi:hypothetical protein
MFGLGAAGMYFVMSDCFAGNDPVAQMAVAATLGLTGGAT